MDSEELKRFENIRTNLEANIKRYSYFHATQGKSEGMDFDTYYKCLIRIMQGEDIFNGK